MSVDRECDIPKEGVKGTRKVCQLVGRCDGHGGDVSRLGELWQLSGSVSVLREVCQVLERCVS